MGFFRIMGIVPLGIGLTVLGFLWFGRLGPFGESVPLFFRVFGSFIALSFILMGSGILSGKLPMTSAELARRMTEMQGLAKTTTAKPGTAFQCPNCGASLGNDADVSPNGDVKCVHCLRWFNIHRAS